MLGTGIFEGKRVFISGPMTGMEGWNRAAFAGVRGALAGAGAADVMDPAGISAGDDRHGHAHWMLWTLRELTSYSRPERPGGDRRPYWDALVLLDGWEGSAGARTERAAAEACGIAIFEWRDVVGRGDAL